MMERLNSMETAGSLVSVRLYWGYRKLCKRGHTPDDVLGGDSVVGVFVGVVYDVLAHDGCNTDPVFTRYYLGPLHFR